jgi:hypothetical protein
MGRQRFVDQELGELLRGENIANSRILGFAAREKPSTESLDQLIVVEDPPNGFALRAGQHRKRFISKPRGDGVHFGTRTHVEQIHDHCGARRP